MRSLSSRCQNKFSCKEVKVMQEWETPEFEEIETQCEVTAYAGHWE
jgi:coenzyme PQQ precursor peptide PqqA